MELPGSTYLYSFFIAATLHPARLKRRRRRAVIVVRSDLSGALTGGFRCPNADRDVARRVCAVARLPRRCPLANLNIVHLSRGTLNFRAQY